MDPIMVDAESLVSQYLRGHDDVADLFGEDIYTALPGEFGLPVLLITRVFGGPISTRPLRIDRPTLSLDVWSDTRRSAFEAAATVNQALAELPDAGSEVGVVAGVRITTGPDHSYDPERPDLHRYRSSARLTTHPLSSVAS